MDAVLY